MNTDKPSAAKPQPKSSGTGVSPVCCGESRDCCGPETHGRDARATAQREKLRKLRKPLWMEVWMA